MKAFRFAILVAGLVVISVPGGLDSCAVSAPAPVFATAKGPADPEQFVKGRIGVLRRSYEPRYLFGAFQILSGRRLRETELQMLYPAQPQPALAPYPFIPLEEWTSARNAVRGLGKAPQVTVYKQLNTSGLVYSFENCKQDAFAKAVEILNSVKRQWGAEDPRTLAWVRAQDQVFANCSAREAVIPAEAEPRADTLVAEHRRYQIAAAFFYSGQFREASRRFGQIAVDMNSPWREIAPYLVARSLLRAGMFDGDRQAYREGGERLLAILKNPAQSKWHDASLGLLHLWQLRVEPRARLAELNRELMRPVNLNEDRTQSVIDFMYLVKRRADWTGRAWTESELAEVESTIELAAWMLAMSEHPPTDAGEHAVRWWRRTANPAWLIAAIANGEEKDLPELLAAAKRIRPRAPAYESVAYYAIQREIARGNEEAARNWADSALSGSLLLSSRNLILSQRASVARDLHDYLRFALRRPEPNTASVDGDEAAVKPEIPTGMAPVFDGDVIDVFNMHLPLSFWVDASANAALPAHMQLRIATTGWLRAVLLGRQDEAHKLMQRVVELQPDAAGVGSGFLSAQNPEEAGFAALYIALRTPLLSPILLDAWFMAANLAKSGYRGGCWSYVLQPPRHDSRAPSFLSASERAAGEEEWEQIRTSAPWHATHLLRETLDWAGKHPDDRRIPEALHRAVMASFFRCKDQETGKYSRQAYLLLHQRYGKSVWAARTPYWYN